MTQMNTKALWFAKHWGLGIGTLMAAGGLLMAAPGNMVTWRISQHTDNLFGDSLVSKAYTRINEKQPQGFKTVGILPDSHELKGLGVSSMVLGSCLLLSCSISLKKEYERLEKANWMIRQSEFELADHEYIQKVELDKYDTEKEVEIDKWKIDLDTQTQISNMIQPPKSYYAKSEDQPQLKPEPDFSRTATGFLAWLQQKAEKLGNNFEVRWCCQQSFGGEKSTKEEVLGWIEELTKIEQASWLDEEKKSFRLLNV